MATRKMTDVGLLDGLRVDRTDSRPLSIQLAAALERIVVRRKLSPGTVIPGLREIARSAGVSLRVARESVFVLRQKGLVTARPRAGTVVQKGARPTCGGELLIILSGGSDTYWPSVMTGRVESRLLAAGWKTFRYIAYRMPDDRLDASGLDLALAKKPDFILTMTTKDVAAKLEASGIPYALTYHLPYRPKGCVATFRISRDRAVRHLITVCRRQKIRRVLSVTQGLGVGSQEQDFAAAGLAVEVLRVPSESSSNACFSLRSNAYRLLHDRFSRPRANWPDLVYFADDGAAVGGFLALLELGVRVPEDVRVVSFANRGSGPVFIKPVTCIQNDPTEVGDRLADCLIDYFRTGRLRSKMLYEAVWIEGETF